MAQPLIRFLAVLFVALPMGLGASPFAHSETQLLNASYDPTRELYKDINAAFAAEWKAKTGEDIVIKQSHGGSGRQAQAVIDGLAADVVTLALSADIDAIARQTKKIPATWQSRLPHNSAPYTSAIVFLVRKGNPKGIKDWGDLAKPGIGVITPNPKTSGGARWNFMAAWGYAFKTLGEDEGKARDFVASVYKNVVVLDAGARGATLTFARREIGDVLIAWENEAFLAMTEFGREGYEMVTPSLSILAEPPVAVIDANADARGTRRQAEAYLQFLYTPLAQKIVAKHFYRPRMTEAADPADLSRFAKIGFFTIDEPFIGGWAKVQARHFSNGGTFDQIYGR